MTDPTVRVEGLQELRRALKRVDDGAAKELQKVIRQAGESVAKEAGRLAPRGTGPIPKSRRPRKRLADSYRSTSSGAKAVVKSRLPYAPVVEYRKHGTPAQMRAVRPVGRAMEKKAAEVEKRLADGIENVINRAGF